ncbi:MAG: ABC transporter permease [Pseudomonadota bacterium]
MGQILEITLMNLRNLVSRLGSSLVIVVGIAGVVAVLVGLLAMAAGFRAALQSASVPERAIVLRDQSNGELSSGMSNVEYNIVSQFEGVAVLSPELYVVADIPKMDTGTPANVVLRGVGPDAFVVRPEIEVIKGRRFEPGRNELLVGQLAAVEFAGLEVGAEIELKSSRWRIVGHFAANGSAYESEVWADLPVAQSAFNRGGALSSMRVLLEQPSLAASVAEAIKADPRLDLALTTEDQFYAEQSEGLSSLITSFGYAVATIMAIGAVFAALNTMYTAVSTRSVEIATLRALGFGALPVVISVLIEALLLAFLGGALGGLVVWLLFDGYTASTLNNASFSQVAFDFAVTPQLLQTGLVWALVLGAIGGLLPALRAARLPIFDALRGE